METKNCIGCSQSIELKKFYFNKTNASYSARCGNCTRKQVLRRYHMVTKLKAIEARRTKGAGLYGVEK